MVTAIERTNSDSQREKRQETCSFIERPAEDTIHDDEKEKLQDIVFKRLDKITHKIKRESAKKMLSKLIKESKVNLLLFFQSPECWGNNELLVKQDV